MITVRRPVVTARDGKSRLAADIDVDGTVYPLWYEVDEKYGGYLCAERSDAFVIGLLHYALVEHQDIVCEAPLTERLRRQILEMFIPAVCNENRGDVTPISITVLGGGGNGSDLIDHMAPGNAVGGSITCGVDSLYSIYSHRDEMTHLVVNKCHGATAAKTKEKLFADLIDNAAAFCREAGKQLIIGNTNYDGGGIPGIEFEGQFTYANCFAVYALQKLFRRYYLATGVPLSSFRMDCFVGGDPAHYELLSTTVFSTDSLTIITDGLIGRLEKVRALADYPLAQRHLDVCWNGAGKRKRNGTCDCPKCMRTVLELMAVGGDACLSRFSAVFDVDYVFSHKEEYFAELLRGKIQKNEFALEVWPLLKGMPFCFTDFIRGGMIVFRKMIKKLLRGGKTSRSFSPRG